ncbi:MAG TPA: hypothetical protein VGQ70_01810, partial [Candidatus Udaeobacter sp.]|nr:hypothetical protein [Candidatus Udaeobacter sp.]
MNSHPPLNLPWIVNGICDPAKSLRLIKPQVVSVVVARIVRLKVIEHVSYLHCKLQTDSLCNFELFPECCIDVPPRQAAKVTYTTAAIRVEAQHAAPEHRENGGRV